MLLTRKLDRFEITVSSGSVMKNCSVLHWPSPYFTVSMFSPKSGEAHFVQFDPVAFFADEFHFGFVRKLRRYFVDFVLGAQRDHCRQIGRQ